MKTRAAEPGTLRSRRPTRTPWSIIEWIEDVVWRALSWCPLHVADSQELSENTWICARVLGGLHLVGASLALVWLVLPHGSGVDNLGVATCVLGAYVVGLWLWLWGRRMSFAVIELELAFTITVLISGGVYFAGPRGAPFALFYVLAALYAFGFLRPSRAFLLAGLIATGYAAALIAGSGPAGIAGDATSWVIVVGVVFVSGGLLLALSEGLRRGERRFRNGLEASSIGAALVDVDSHFAYVNPSLRSLMSEVSEPAQMTLSTLLAEPPAAELTQALIEVHAGERESRQIEGRIAGPHGKEVLITLSQLREREPLHALVQIEDVSDRVRALSASRRLAAVVESSNDAIFTQDLNGIVLSWNKGAERLYGYRASEIIGCSVAVLIPPERPTELSYLIDHVRDGTQLNDWETVWLNRDAQRLDVALSVTAIREGSAEPNSVAVIARDVTEQRRMERKVADSERRYRLLFERNPQPMWVYDPQTLRFLAVNDCAIRSYGYTREEFMAMTLEDIRPSEDVHRLHRSLTSAEAGLHEGDCWRHVKRSGEVIDVEVLSDEIDFDGVPARLVVATDITSRLEAERRLRHQADHDALTALWNRSRLERELNELLESGHAQDCALVVFDIDHFKYINDSSGHAYGDELLKAVASRLSGLLHEGQRLARLGGDEFALLLRNTSESQAREISAHMVAELKRQPLIAGRRVTASAGIAASSNDHRVSGEDLLIAADIALYDAKDAGRDRVAVAVGVKRGHTWIDEIRGALAEDRLVLHGQPIVDVNTGETVREELLLRMLDERGEIIPPASFIPASERFGLINEIDRWVVGQALELASTGRRLEVNLSAHSLGDREITRMVAGAVEAGVDPDNVVFEITETAAAANYREAADFAERLARIGCGFALDDFGTGFGSLSYLRHIPFAYLKIDMEFVRDLTREARSQRIVRVVVNIASHLGQKTIAEGVENEMTLNILRSLGVNHAQGYHIARPAPVGDIAARGRLLNRAEIL